MSYVVLARRWRPETFADVVGQRHVVLTLSAAVRTGRIAHAYLFAGPRGVGKTTVARILAKALNCAQGPTDEPCMKCDSCAEIATGRSLDVIEIDGASNRRIEDARGIRETVQYAPLSGRTKIYIIDEAHMLTREAFNALLKTLEEPPAHVVFVLATTEPGKIPDTIVSRCQRFDFHRIPQADIELRLRQIADAEGVELGDGALGLIAAKADGSMRDGESLLDQLMSVCEGTISAQDVADVLGIPDIDVYFGLTDAIADGSAASALSVLSQALDQGSDPRDVIEGLVNHLGNLLMAKAAPDSGAAAARLGNYRDREGPSFGLAEEELVRLMRIGVEAQAAAKWSTQPGLIVELALVRMSRLSRTVELEDVVRALEDGSGGSGKPRDLAEEGRGGVGGGRTREARRRASARPAPSGSGESRPEGTRDDPGERGQAAATAPAADVERWQHVVERIRKSKPALAAFLGGAQPSGFAAGEFAVHLPNGSTFHRDQLQDRGNMKLMEKLASEVVGEPVRIAFAFDAPPAVAAQSADPSEAIDHDVSRDPMIKKVMDMFDGRIRNVREGE